MPFTDDQKTTLTEITDLSFIELTDYLNYYDEITNGVVENQVISDIELWNENRNDFTDFQPTAANKGLHLETDRLKMAIKRRVCRKLNINHSTGTSPQRLSRS